MVYAPGIFARTQNMKARYNDGVQTGQLTPAEQNSALSVWNQQKDTFSAFKADGRLTFGERLLTHGALNLDSAGLFVQKHNLNVVS